MVIIYIIFYRAELCHVQRSRPLSDLHVSSGWGDYMQRLVENVIVGQLRDITGDMRMSVSENGLCP
jgi:hypothetical protein